MNLSLLLEDLLVEAEARVTLDESKYIHTHTGTHKYTSTHDAAEVIYPDYSSVKSTAHRQSKSRLNSAKRKLYQILYATIDDYLRTPSKSRSFDSFSSVIKLNLKKAYFDAYRLGVEGSGATIFRNFKMSSSEADWINSALTHESRFL